MRYMTYGYPAYYPWYGVAYSAWPWYGYGYGYYWW